MWVWVYGVSVGRHTILRKTSLWRWRLAGRLSDWAVGGEEEALTKKAVAPYSVFPHCSRLVWVGGFSEGGGGLIRLNGLW